MKTPTSFALLAVAVVGFTGCASAPKHQEEMQGTHQMRTYKETRAFNDKTELQCDVFGLHTLASDTPDYLSALRGFGDETGRRSVLLD